MGVSVRVQSKKSYTRQSGQHSKGRDLNARPLLQYRWPEKEEKESINKEAILPHARGSKKGEYWQWDWEMECVRSTKLRKDWMLIKFSVYSAMLSLLFSFSHFLLLVFFYRQKQKANSTLIILDRSSTVIAIDRCLLHYLNPTLRPWNTKQQAQAAEEVKGKKTKRRRITYCKDDWKKSQTSLL